MEVELNELDRRIWERELADWLPERVFDFHSHIQHSCNLRDPGTEVSKRLMGYMDLSAEDLDDVYRTLALGRSVRYLVTHFPDPAYDTTSANRYVARERPPESYSLMVVTPRMTEEEVERTVRKEGHVGLKPYMTYADVPDRSEARISDFLPPHQMEVADRLGLVVLLHLSKSRAAADPENLEELSWYSRNFPRARIVLAHCARCFNPWTLELALPKLGKLDLAYDTAAVCDGEVFEELIAAVGPGRVLYGSDLVSSTLFRGKYVGIGESWTSVTEDSFSWRRAAGPKGRGPSTRNSGPSGGPRGGSGWEGAI